MTTGESKPEDKGRTDALSSWLPDDWRSPAAWLEQAHRAARLLRRDVAHVTPWQLRQAIEVASRLNPGPWGGDFREVKTEHWHGAEVKWKEHDEGTVVWVHGGAFAFGSPRVYRAAAVHLARQSRCKVVLPVYRLAPEHPFPAAHDDVLAMLRHCLSHGEKLVLMGDSAGANLVLSAVEQCQKEGLDLAPLAGVAVLSPWCDLRQSSASVAQNAIAHSPFDQRDALEYIHNYLNGHDPRDPRVSPLMSSFQNWPPVYLEYAEDEFLAPDVKVLEDRFQKAGVVLHVRTEPRAVHGWQVLPEWLPEARRSSLAMGFWVRRALSLPPLPTLPSKD